MHAERQSFHQRVNWSPGDEPEIMFGHKSPHVSHISTSPLTNPRGPYSTSLLLSCFDHSSSSCPPSVSSPDPYRLPPAPPRLSSPGATLPSPSLPLPCRQSNRHPPPRLPCNNRPTSRPPGQRARTRSPTRTTMPDSSRPSWRCSPTP